MKETLVFLLLLPLFTQGQIQSTTGYGNQGSITLTPEGFVSAFSGQNLDTTNVALGSNALINITLTTNPSEGKTNTAIGSYSLRNNTTGYGNTALGNNALQNNTTGIVNTALGYNALPRNIDGFENVAVGNAAMLSSLTGSRNVSLGTASLLFNKGGNHNTAVGHGANWFNTYGNGNTSVGYFAHKSNITGSNNTALGFEADASTGDLTNSIAIGYQAIVNTSNKAVIGNASTTTVGGYGSWTNYSDRRLKENIEYSDALGLEFILNLKTATYNYISDSNKRKRNGLIAQDIQKYLTDNKLYFSGLVKDNDSDETLNLSYSEFVIPLINAIQKQQKDIEYLKTRILDLEDNK